VIAKRKGVVARWGLKEAWSKRMSRCPVRLRPFKVWESIGGSQPARAVDEPTSGVDPIRLALQSLRSADLRPSNVAPWEAVRDWLNQKLKGWEQYFRPGEPMARVRGARCTR
jgi:hypothetical protein